MWGDNNGEGGTKGKTKMYQEDANTSKRISFQSIFSSLCNLYQHTPLDESLIADIEKITYDINSRLHKKYPCDLDVSIQKPMQNQPAQGSGAKQKIKICPVPDCGQPMIRQYNKKNPKAPDWKCSDPKCKFSKAYGGGWKKSTYITGDWDPDPREEARANKEDSYLEEAQQQSYDEGVPAEYQ